MTGPFDHLEGYPKSEYIPEKAMMDRLNSSMTEIRLVLFTGSWCPDCLVLIPRLGAVLEQITTPVIVEIHQMERGKPLQSALDMDVMAIPTIIVKREGKELGRVVEYPRTTLEDDLIEYSSK